MIEKQIIEKDPKKIQVLEFSDTEFKIHLIWLCYTANIFVIRDPEKDEREWKWSNTWRDDGQKFSKSDEEH